MKSFSAWPELQYVLQTYCLVTQFLYFSLKYFVFHLYLFFVVVVVVVVVDPIRDPVRDPIRSDPGFVDAASQHNSADVHDLLALINNPFSCPSVQLVK